MEEDERGLLWSTIAEVTGDHDQSELVEALDRIGWPEMLATAPEVAVPAVLEGQGRSGHWSAALHDVVASALGVGERTTVLLPFPGERGTAVGDGSSIELRGLVLGGRVDCRQVVAAVCDGSRNQIVALVAVEASEITTKKLAGLDPAIGAAELTASTPVFTELVSVDTPSDRWDRAVADARWAVSHQLVGLMEAAQAMALAHARERRQFGRQIGSFQAVRHRLAETHVAVCAARAAAEAAGPTSHSWPSDTTDACFASMMAKLVAGCSATEVIGHCQQVLAGIGYTTQHPFHRYMKRIVVLERILGDSSELSQAVGILLATRGEAPRLVNL